MPSLVEAMVEGLRASTQFRALPMMNRPLDTLWHAHEQTMLALRQPLYHHYLRKSRPKPAAFTAAIEQGLSLLGAFAEQTGTERAIVRFSAGEAEAISFQPRPFMANWTLNHLLTPVWLNRPDRDPLLAWDPNIRPDQMPRIQISDVLHLARKVALAFITAQSPDASAKEANGTVTIEFNGAQKRIVRMVYHRRHTPPGAPSTAIHQIQR